MNNQEMMELTMLKEALEIVMVMVSLQVLQRYQMSVVTRMSMVERFL